MRPLANRLLAPAILAIGLPAAAYDVNERFSIGGTLAAVGQCQDVSARLPGESYDSDGTLDAFDNTCRGGMPFQLELSLRPDPSNELFLKVGFAVENALNGVSPWALAPWAADLEDDLEDLNGRSRDYLLTAWYKHSFELGENRALGASFGIIDATDYLDANAYANDEYGQFMNEALVNAPTLGLPSYDAGAAVEWTSGPWSFNAMGMNVGENDDGEGYNFWGAQAGYAVESRLGAGNYRLIVSGTSGAFYDPEGMQKESRLAWGLSFDQGLSANIGAFLRFGWQQEDAAVDYKALYSGGLDFNGGAWGRGTDNAGLGYAYLAGGNLDLDHTHVFEGYYRLGINDHLALTADVQYMEDSRTAVDPRQEDPAGWIFGMRLTAQF